MRWAIFDTNDGAGMSVRTVRAYERRGRLPSQLKQPRTYRSRPDPFAEDWPWVAAQLERDPALQGQTLFGLLCEQHPGRYQASQLRTLQRHIAAWRAQSGPEREVIFPQVHDGPLRLIGSSSCGRWLQPCSRRADRRQALRSKGVSPRCPRHTRRICTTSPTSW